MPTNTCSACGKEITDAESACPYCGKSPAAARRRRGLPLPTWAKILILLVPGVLLFSYLVATKPTEADLRQAIRDKANELKAKDMTAPALLLDVPQFADKFTFHDSVISSEIRFTSDNGRVIIVARGEFGTITVSEKW